MHLATRLTVTALVVLSAATVHGQVGSRWAELRNPVVKAVEAAGPAVVNISTQKIITVRTGLPRSFLGDDLFFERFGQTRDIRRRSLGSGVIFDSRGYIVTNEHVVRRASKITVTLKDKSSYEGRLISADWSRDLAVIKITRKTPFPAANIRRTQELMIGETAIAVGNPFGFEHTVTVGVVSATGRTAKVSDKAVIKDLIQTDASINPGNSGGALLDVNGDLIGINTAIRSDAEGIGFAIPLSVLRKGLVDLVDFRRLGKVWLGMGLIGVVNRQTREPAGISVTEVHDGSPAAKAGIKPGDMITKLNGKPCLGVLAFEIDVLEHKLGDELVFEGVRDGKPLKIAVKLQQMPMPDPNETISKRLGMKVGKLSAGDAKRLKVELVSGGSAVIVQSIVPGGSADKAGLRKDDIVVIFGKFNVSDPADLAAILGRLKTGSFAAIVIIRGGDKSYAWIRTR